jgi:hypothetical protein
LRRGRGLNAFVSTQFGITRRRSGRAPFSSIRRRIVSPIATTASARREVAVNGPAQEPDHDAILDPPQLDGGLREHVLHDDCQRRARPARDGERHDPDDGGSVMHSTTSGLGTRSPRPPRPSRNVR